MADIHLDHVTRTFGAARAVNDVSLSVPSGTFLALLGPSGCGKTTLLRLIAGLDRPDGGRLSIGGRVMADATTFVPPEQRSLGMVFQSYALWPHMTVAGNIRFGLQVQHLPRAEQDRRIADALAMVNLTGLDDRRPHELSGGQRQRVALARSLALRPALILLDEPLANLDAHLRATMLAEFRRLHAALGTTFVFVTHDQDEAMAVAGLVGVMNAGRLEQLATPQHLYRQPATPMVARFVGQGRTIPVEVLAQDGPQCRIRLQDRTLTIPGAAPPGPGWLCLRAADLSPDPAGPLRVRITSHRFHAGHYTLTAEIDDGTVDFTHSAPLPQGETVSLALSGGWVLPREPLQGNTALAARLLEEAS